MDANKLSQNVGKLGMLTILQSSLKIEVKILNAREMWGRMDYLVTPINGQGEQWVAASRISITEAL